MIGTLLRVVGLLRSRPVAAGLALGLGIPMVVLTMLQPLVLARIIDDGLVGRSSDAVLAGSFVLAGLAAAQFACSAVRRRIAGRLAIDVQADLRTALGHRILTLDAAWHDRTRTGRVLSSVGSDVDAIRSFLGFGFVFIVIDGLTAIVTVVQMWLLSPLLTVLAAVVVLPVLPLTTRYNTALGSVIRRMQARRAELVNTVHDTAAGFVVVTTAGAQGRQLRQFEEHGRALLADNLDAATVRARYAPAIAALPQIAAAGLLWLGGEAVMAGSLSLGSLVAFNAYLAILAVPIAAVSQLVASAQRAVVGGGRVFEILDARPVVIERPAARTLPRSPTGVHLQLDGVAFRSLHDADLTVGPGEWVSVVGGTGVGKSTLAGLLVRDNDPQRGCIRIDGTDIRDLTLASLRRCVVLARQDAFVFAGTVRGNLLPRVADDDEIRRILRVVDVLDVVDRFPAGLDEPLGDRGHDLSGGQRQRLALARALLRRPRLLVLDGALSEVDPITASRIVERLPAALGSTTVLFLGMEQARPLADRTLRIDGGRLQPDGTAVRMAVGR